MTNIILNIYIVAILVVGILSYRKIKNVDDFFIAGRKAGTLELTGSLLATILGSSAVIGSVNFAFNNGWAGAWFMLCAALGLTILYPLVGHLKEFKGYNLPALMETFYGKEVKILASFIIPIAWTGIVASQIMGASKIIGVYSDISYTNGILISGFVFILYTALGGQLSIIKTDFIQFLLILTGIVACFFYTSSNFEITASSPIINEGFGFGDLLVMILTYSTTFFVGPDIYSRIFCAKDEKTAKRSILLSVSILLPLAFILAALGVYTSNIFPGLNIGEKSALMYLASDILPGPLTVVLYFGLLSAVISSADTTLLTAASTFTQVFTGNLREKKSIGITRVFILLFGILSIVIALKLQFILASFFLALSVYSGAFIIPCLLGIFGYRAPKTYVITAIILGGGTALYGKLFGGSSSNYYIILAFILNSLVLTIPMIKRRSFKLKRVNQK